MKIINVQPALYKNLNSIQNTRSTVTSPVISKPVKDIVSFSGLDDEESICDRFGLLKEGCVDRAAENITNCFETSVKKGEEKEVTLNKFSWKANDNQIDFFGDELDFVKALNEKKIKTEDFNALTNEKFSMISYNSGGAHYDLKYDKKTHELVAASAGVLKDSPKDAIERIAIKKSNNNEGDYVFHYQFIDDSNSERAVEDTYVLFDKNMQAKASHTEKYFQYSDGEREEQKFACTYDEDGMPETADTKELSPYIW